jgi:hypothetical protein
MTIALGRQNVNRIFLFLGVSILPIYTSASGSIQPSHALLAIFILLSVPDWSRGFKNWTYIYLALCGWVLIRDYLSSVVNSDPSLLLPSLYWAYNFLLILAIFFSARDRDFFNLLKICIFLSVVIAFLGVLILGYSITVNQDGMRAVGTFNNPNQLGFFSVCVSSILFLFMEVGLVKKRYFFIFMVLIQFLAIASLSKAAMVSNLFLFLLILIKTKYSGKNQVIAMTVLAIFLLPVVFFLGNLNYEEFRFYQRLSAIGSDDDDSLQERGYFAFLRSGDFDWIAGPGAKLVLKLVGHEVHSTIFSVFNNYGLIGFILISLILILWFLRIKNSFGFFCALGAVMPSMIYGITHNGSRFTLFWVLFSSSLALCNRKLKFLKF